MIPADVASRLQVSADSALRPVAPTQEIADKLSGLVAGQKVMAEIQAMLPNGTYRAMINQRQITLALPFAAKSGDTLELQVTESDGKLALAVLSRPDGDVGKTAVASTSATLSRTGQLISTLFSGAREAKGSQALPLNGNQPLASAPPNSAQDLLPQLKQAIAQSGMFYEAHQAEWIEGRLTKSALLQEPQGKLSSPAAFTAALVEEQTSTALLKAPPASAGDSTALPFAKASAATNSDSHATMKAPLASEGDSTASLFAKTSTLTNPNDQATKTVHVTAIGHPATAEAATIRSDSASIQTNLDGSKTSSTQAQGQVVAPQVQPVVQQQLDALATQTFAWQGQVWPGQEMRWEIDEDATRHGVENDETAANWTTRLNLTLPNLGEVAAQIRLQGDQVSLTISAGNVDTRELIRASSLAFRRQLDEAGLMLASMGVDGATESRANGQAGQ